MTCEENKFRCKTCKENGEHGRTTPPTSKPTPIRYVTPQKQSLGDRLKGLIQYTENPDEVDVLIDAYKKILRLNERYIL